MKKKPTPFSFHIAASVAPLHVPSSETVFFAPQENVELQTNRDQKIVTFKPEVISQVLAQFKQSKTEYST